MQHLLASLAEAQVFMCEIAPESDAQEACVKSMNEATQTTFYDFLEVGLFLATQHIANKINDSGAAVEGLVWNDPTGGDRPEVYIVGDDGKEQPVDVFSLHPEHFVGIWMGGSSTGEEAKFTYDKPRSVEVIKMAYDIDRQAWRPQGAECVED